MKIQKKGKNKICQLMKVKINQIKKLNHFQISQMMKNQKKSKDYKKLKYKKKKQICIK